MNWATVSCRATSHPDQVRGRSFVLVEAAFIGSGSDGDALVPQLGGHRRVDVERQPGREGRERRRPQHRRPVEQVEGDELAVAPRVVGGGLRGEAERILLKLTNSTSADRLVTAGPEHADTVAVASRCSDAGLGVHKTSVPPLVRRGRSKLVRCTSASLLNPDDLERRPNGPRRARSWLRHRPKGEVTGSSASIIQIEIRFIFSNVENGALQTGGLESADGI